MLTVDIFSSKKFKMKNNNLGVVHIIENKLIKITLKIKRNKNMQTNN